jgi:hypothetical protein
MLLLFACAPAEVAAPADTVDAADADTDADGDTDADTDADTDTGVADCEATCDDGLGCTEDLCDDQDRCVHSPVDTCDWPAGLPPDGVEALAGLDEDFRVSLSGATWDAVQRVLWVVRGNGATAWRVVEDGAGGWEIATKQALGNLDAESLVVVDPEGAPDVVHVAVELEEVVTAFDVSGDDAVELRTWDTSPWLETSGSRGSEGMTFVPDAALSAWGFVDGEGAPRRSALGYGGLFFVGTQNGGNINVFDLSATDGAVEFVGTYVTSRTDTSGLEFDAGTGRLYIWHGGDDNDLEVVRLASGDAGAGQRAFETEAIFDHPSDDNLEGMALLGLEDCDSDGRPLVFTIDDGGDRALDVYPDWPLCGP